jgi:dihydrolipoamide dehydrogenase
MRPPIIEILAAPGQAVNAECADPAGERQSDDGRAGTPGRYGRRAEGPDRRSCQPGGDVIILLEATGAAATPPKDRITRDGVPAPSYGSPSGVYETIDVRVPDIGDFKGIPLIEVGVAAGAQVNVDDPLSRWRATRRA